MKNKTAAAIAAALTASVLGTAAVSAAQNTFLITESTIANGTQISEATEIATGIEGLKMRIGADTWSYKADSRTYNGISYTGRIYGANNANPAGGTGTYFEFELAETAPPGTLEIMYQINGGKALYITDGDSAVTAYDGITYDGHIFTDKTTQSAVFDAEGGHTYRLYSTGSKASFYGVTYLDTAAAEEAKKKAFAEEIAAYSFDNIKGENADEAHIDSDLILTDNYPSKFGSCDVSWSTSNESVIDRNGNVSAEKTDVNVVLTGKFSVQEDNSLTAERTFNLTVLADPDDASAVAAAKEALTLGDISALKHDLTLPSEGKRGTAVAWSTSDESVVTADGKVTRYPGEDKTAVLTARISRGDASDTKTFEVTVSGYVPVTVDTYVYADGDGNTRFTPADGGSLKKISFTSSMKDPSADDKLAAVIYDKDGHVKSAKMISVTAEDYEKSCGADIDLPMDSTDVFKIMALNIGTMQPYIEAFSADDTVKDGAVIYVVGDSTAASYGNDRYPRTGWAQMLQNYFDDVEVVNLAISGRSSLSFKTEANYTRLKNEIKAGDYLIIQFGHNDSKADDASRYTDPSLDRFTDGSYKKSMYEYIELARDKGAYPILATSISRRQLSDSSLERYVNAAKELGDEADVPVLDLYKRTNGYINIAGTEEAKSMFNWVKVNDSRFINDPEYASSAYKTSEDSDNTHINKYGADIISQWATEEMSRLGISLASKVNDYQAVYPLPSYAEAVSAE